MSKDTSWKFATELFADDLVAVSVVGNSLLWMKARNLVAGYQVMTAQGWARVNYAPQVEQARLKWY